MSAVSWMQAMSHTSFPGRTGFCLGTVRRAFGAPGGTHDAQDAWNNTRHKHRFNGNYNDVPANRPFYYSGGRHGYGHVVVTAGRGMAYGTDYKRRARIDLHRLSDPVHAWGYKPLGYGDDINGKTIYAKESVQPPPPPPRPPVAPPAETKEKEVVIAYRTAKDASAYEVAGPGLVYLSKARADALRKAGTTVLIVTLPTTDKLWKLPRQGSK